MVAPVIAAPEGSVTEPVTEPVICCPDSGNAIIRAVVKLKVDTQSFGKGKRTMIHLQTSQNVEYGLMFLKLCFPQCECVKDNPNNLDKSGAIRSDLSERFQRCVIAIYANPMIGEAQVGLG
jgi:hypothetical protein